MIMNTGLQPRLSWFSNCLLMKTLLSILILFIPVLAMTHPGHGADDGWSIVHYLFNYEHAIPFALVVVVAIILFARLLDVKKSAKNS